MPTLPQYQLPTVPQIQPAPYGLDQFPGYDAIMSDIKGIISPDVKTQLTQTAAERGIRMGMPGAPATDAALMRAIGLTSDTLRSRGIAELEPLYQQGVSEAGQTSRLGMSLANQMEIAKLQEAGLSARQAAALSNQIQLEQMRLGSAASLQSKELAAAMERLKVGNASQKDIEKLRIASQEALQTQEIASKEKMQQQQLELEKYIADLRDKLGYYGINQEAARYGAAAAPRYAQVSASDKMGGRTDQTVVMGPGGTFIPVSSPYAYGQGLPPFEGEAQSGWTDTGLPRTAGGALPWGYQGVQHGTMYMGPSGGYTDWGNMTDEEFNDALYYISGGMSENPVGSDSEFWGG